MKKYKGRPFVLVGVNSDRSAARVKKLMQNGTVTWNSWLDGSTKGPISSRWDVQGWPTSYILDHDGVIRHKGGPNDGLIEQLVQQAEGGK